MAEQASENRQGFIINGQYIKDLSFENPQAPKSLFMTEQKPAIELAVDLKAQRLKDDSYELELNIAAKAMAEKEPIFVVELAYAGIFTLQNTPPEQAEPLLLIECPQVLFPFARRVIADVTRDGGFPPLMLEPMDFRHLYEARKASQAAPEAEVVN
jgi:preprotein translocase subunit SecB